jgi:ADP-ribosyl-[dinitrogen reductase] hydrolase
MQKIQQVGEKILPFVAYGDSSGLPFEAKSSSYMREFISEHGSISGLNDTTTNPYIGSYPAGTWSDDTHLSIVMARTLINSPGFNISNLADEHCRALEHVNGRMDTPDLIPPILSENGKTGWGKGTINAVENLLSGIEPSLSGVDTAGNGVLMKIAPLVFWQVAQKINEEKAEDQIIAITKMTHNNPVAIASSLTHKKILEYLLSDTNFRAFDKKQFIENASMIAKKYERRLGSNDVLSKGLEKLNKHFRNNDCYADIILSLTPKHGFYAPETLIMAYGSFLSENIFPESVFRAIELGGDTDSIGSIVSTMSLFLNENTLLPADYEKIYDYERLMKISKQLAKVSIKD